MLREAKRGHSGKPLQIPGFSSLDLLPKEVTGFLVDFLTWEEKLVLMKEYAHYLRLYSIFVLNKISKYCQPSLPYFFVSVGPHWEAQDMACHIFQRMTKQGLLKGILLCATQIFFHRVKYIFLKLF